MVTTVHHLENDRKPGHASPSRIRYTQSQPDCPNPVVQKNTSKPLRPESIPSIL